MNARERFEQTRRAVERLAEVQALIMSGCDDWRPSFARDAANEISDPTANSAIRNVDVVQFKLDELRKEETELLNEIGESLQIIQAVRRCFGDLYGDIIEWRYIDGKSWGRIRDDYNLTKSAGCYRLGIAFDWIDSIGISRLLQSDADILSLQL